MTTRVFIAGSMNIKHLDPKVKERIDNIVAQDFEVVVGDADGADTSIQCHLLNHGTTKTTVFCSGAQPRNNVGNWPVQRVETNYAKGSRAFFTAKDIRMAEVADIGLMIWDTKSTGTLSNVIELLTRKKKSVVFVNKAKAFKNIATVEQLEELLSCMSEHSKQKADEKIGLFNRINALKHEQIQMFA
jgi:ACT domain-containing protein